MPTFPRFIRIWLGLCILTAAAARAGNLVEDFENPPPAAKPYVWWHWMSDNVSELGIDKDLEAMKACGVGGATVCDVGSTTSINRTSLAGSPWKVDFLSERWWELMNHAVARGGELGLDMGMHNCGGWSASGGPWITPDLSMQALVWSKTHVDGPKEIDVQLPRPTTTTQLDFYKDVALLAVPDQAAAPDRAIEIKSGTSKWSVPAGAWTIYRFGHVSSGKTMHPMPDRFTGLEADKLSAKAAEVHLKHILDDAKQHLGPAFGKSFKHILFDSYEARDQTWTEGYREHFTNRRGYDPLAYLPLMDNPRLYDSNVTARFQYDVARTTAELFLENDFQVYHKMLKEAGITDCLEPYKGPFDPIASTAACDVPMGEFWTFPAKRANRNIIAAAQALGRTIVGAEAFTGRPTDSQWSEDPAFLKVYADQALCDGVNRFYLHEWTLQPFDDSIVPGMTCGWWGTHFSRHQTWFEPGKAFFKYIARCSAVLQHGQAVVDYCTLGFNDDAGDAISEAMLQDCSVNGGRLVTKTGRSYSLLVLPLRTTTMLPETARKLKQLVDDGASILGPKPAASPSLSNYPDCDREVVAIANELWGDNSAPGPHVFGKGMVYTNMTAAEVLKAKSVDPDFRVEASIPPRLNAAHRREGSTDVYFVSNPTSQSVTVQASFRVNGKTPELWDPVSGARRRADQWSEEGKRTRVALTLSPIGSAFVVFTERAVGDPTRSDPPIAASPAKPPMEIPGPWTVRFIPGRGAPESIKLSKLESWSQSTDVGVKYFSGTGTYTTDFDLPAQPYGEGRRVLLDLGRVKSAAMVKLNGQDLGAVWCPIDGLDVTDKIVAGTNHLEVAVSNTWKNRLIGDEQQPADVEWGSVQIYNRQYPNGRPLIRFPDWLVAHTPRPSTVRFTFTTWNYFDSKTALEEAGLLGPVMIREARAASLGENR